MNKRDFLDKEHFSFEDITELVRILRAPDGCPWDREQTHTSIRNNFLEEVYEAVEGIDKADSDILREELGDVLLQILLHAAMEAQDGRFTINDVLDTLGTKLVFRHPHVFGTMTADNPEQALQNWDALKKKEKGHKTPVQAVVSVSSSLPALMRAQKLGVKAEKNHLWENTAAQSAAENFSQFMKAQTAESAGKLLFDICAMCAQNGVDAEQALFTENEKFCKNIRTEASDA